ncbi:L-type lectin-domain containing receptor kinase IX.1 [Manihot esculenta]|nr:L-type lectin-domain containing receptor kinase IX.1 [Manihot esculenta]
MVLNSHLHLPNFHFLLCIWMPIFLFIPITMKSFATSLKLTYTSFDSNHPDIYTEINTTVGTTGIELTTNLRDQREGGSIGRATYKQPLHLWDKTSGNLTNFTTHFSLIIDSEDKFQYGDGLTFFLVPNGSKASPETRSGGNLALAINDSVALDTQLNNFVAVEFDTFTNPWDPDDDHIGVDIRSMRSVVTAPWLSNIRQGNRTDAWITYDSSQKLLHVSFTYVHRSNNSIMHGNLSAKVDLAKFLPEWVTFGFSGSTGSLSQINRITSWEFSSSSEIVDAITISNSDTEPAAAGSGSNRGLMAGFIVGACILIVSLGFVLFRLWGKKKKEEKRDDLVFELSLDDNFKNGTGPRKFSYDELAVATNNFSENEKLGEGGFGAVYRGFLKDLNYYVAVKRVSRESKQGIKEYAAEVKIINRMRHRNLVKLIGWCHEKELLLAYELMPNGSLDSHLFNGRSLLTWDFRYKIAQGLASALLYLHEEGDQCVLHRDIKSSNIILDSNFDAKLGDFGLARLVDHGKGSQTTVLAGTMGYMAPECFTSGKASKESDVYSFGVVALEIACGRRAVEPRFQENQTRIVEWVWELYGIGKLLESADPKLCRDFDEQEMERLLIVGLWCVHPDARFRPSIRQVINVLSTCEAQAQAPLPILPPEMPVPAYLSPPMKLSISFLMASCGSAANSDKNDSSKLTSSSGTSSPSVSLLLNTR